MSGKISDDADKVVDGTEAVAAAHGGSNYGILITSIATFLAAQAKTLTNKTIDAANNTISNLATSMFAANVIDTDGTLAANSDTRIASQKAVKTYADLRVVGPASATDGNFAFYNGATGKIIKDSSVALDTDGTFAANSDTRIASQKAVKTYAAPMRALAAHNAVLNGAIDVSQELGTTGATLVNNTAKYIADQWEAMYNHGAATAVVTSAQLAAASFGAVLAGVQFAHQIKATTAITSPANGDFAKHRTRLEGYRIAHWGWGAAGAASIVVAFQLYSTATGVALVRLSNSAGDRFYYHEITVAAGWNFYAFTVAGDTSGTWLTTTGVGLVFEVFVSGKETTPGSSLDAWGSTAKIQTTNSTNLLGTNNNQTALTVVYIDAGVHLPVAADMPLLMRPYEEELRLCKRFLQYRLAASTTDHIAMLQGISTTQAGGPLWTYPVEMRPTPTVTVSSDGHLGCSNSAGSFTACTAHSLVAGVQSVKDVITVGSAILTAACATIIAFNNASGFIKADARF